MSRVSTVLITTVTLFLYTIAVTRAQDTKPVAESTPTAAIASPTPTAQPSPWQNNIHYLDFSLADTGYQVNPTRANRNRLLQTAERLINAFCIKGLSPEYRESFKEPGSHCDQFTTRILTIDSANPAATCARLGVDSSECSQAYSTIGVALLGVTEESTSDKDLSIFLESNKNEVNTAEVEDHISELVRTYAYKKKPELRDQIMNTFYDQLVRHCAVTRYDVAPPSPPTPTPVPSKSDKPFDKLLSDLAKQTSNNSPLDKKNSTRTRLVTLPCLKFLTRLKDFDPSHYLYICYTEGLFSPNCVRAQRVQKGKQKSTSPLVSDGIAPF